MVASELENWLTLKLEPLAGLSVQNIGGVFCPNVHYMGHEVD